MSTSAPSPQSADPIPASSAQHVPDNVLKLFQKACRLLDSGHAKEAADELRPHASSHPLLGNTMGVCLLRNGQSTAAVHQFRNLALDTTTFSVRRNVPRAFQTNFATALLMDGHVAGCLEVLRDIDTSDDPEVRRLQATVKAWEQGLSWWARMNWMFGIEPSRKPVLDFQPGVLWSPFVESAPAA